MTDLRSRLHGTADALASGTAVAPFDRVVRRARRRRAAAVVTPLVVGATVLTGVVVLRPEPAPRRPVAPTPAPLVPQTATVSAHGLRVDLRLDRSAVALGERVNATLTVTNTLSRPAFVRGTGGCDLTVRLRDGQPRGAAQPGLYGEFKEAALRGVPLSFPFASGDHPNPLCTTEDIRYHREIAPGGSLRLALWWEAETPLDFPYDGTAQVVASFGALEENEVNGFAVGRQVVTEPLPLRVRGGDPDVVTPAEAVDVALTDPAFLAYLEAHPPSSWDPEHHRPASVTVGTYYHDERGEIVVRGALWWVSLHRARTPRDGHVAVDARTGAVLGRYIPRS
jgi:hypothetical protein